MRPTDADADARAARRDRRRAGVALAIVLPALVASGCGPETAAPPAAEVVDAGPDCLAPAVLDGLGIQPPVGQDRPSPRAGAVPAGFEPVAAVECRGPLSGPVVLAPDPAPSVSLDPPSVEELAAGESDLTGLVGLDGPVPGEPGSVPGEPGAGPGGGSGDEPPEPLPVTVTQVELTGDLDALLAVLRRPSELAGPDQACPAMWQSQPQVYLVDRDSRAVRVAWPTDGCGFTLDGATAPLSHLAEGTVTRHVVPTG